MLKFLDYGFSENKIIDIPLWHSYGSSNMSVFCCFFSGTASYSRGYTGQKFAFTTSLSWHRLGPWLHPFWLHCSQQFYRVPNIKAVFVPSGLIHGWGVHFGLYCRRRLVVTMSLLKFEAIHLHPIEYRGSPISTISLSTMPGIVRFKIILNSTNSPI